MEKRVTWFCEEASLQGRSYQAEQVGNQAEGVLQAAHLHADIQEEAEEQHPPCIRCVPQHRCWLMNFLFQSLPDSPINLWLLFKSLYFPVSGDTGVPKPFLLVPFWPGGNHMIIEPNPCKWHLFHRTLSGSLSNACCFDSHFSLTYSEARLGEVSLWWLGWLPHKDHSGHRITDHKRRVLYT